MRPSRAARRAGLGALAALGACASWRPLGVRDPATALRTYRPPQVRVTVAGWPEPVIVGDARVVGDSLVGRRVGAPGATDGPRVAVPLAAVTRAEAYRGDPPPSVVVPLVLLLGAAVALVLSSLDDFGG